MTCKFLNTSVTATFINTTSISCHVPSISGNSQVSVNVEYAGVSIINNNAVSFVYLGVCTSSTCNGRGYCNLGDCICNANYTGPQCNELIYPPDSVYPQFPANGYATEGELYHTWPITATGQGPIYLSIEYDSQLKDISFNYSSGKINT